MARPTLDAESLQRDRQRYQGFLDQAERQLATCQERMERLQQAIDAIDRLAALAELDGSADRAAPRVVSSQSGPEAGATKPPRRAPAPKARRARAAGGAPSPTSTPAAPDPVTPPAGSAAGAADGDGPAPGTPKGTDALRVILESEPGRVWSLAELLDALGARGWLPASKRPEEGVRISLKRLVERGGAVRVDNGRWRSGDAEPAAGERPEAEAPAPAPEPAPVDGAQPPGQAPQPEPGPDVGTDAEPGPDPEPDPEPRAVPSPPPGPQPPERRTALLPTSFGRPVGGSVTEL